MRTIGRVAEAARKDAERETKARERAERNARGTTAVTKRASGFGSHGEAEAAKTALEAKRKPVGIAKTLITGGQAAIDAMRLNERIGATHSRRKGLEDLIRRGQGKDLGSRAGMKRGKQASSHPSRQPYVKTDGTPGKREYTAKQIAAFNARKTSG